MPGLEDDRPVGVAIHQHNIVLAVSVVVVTADHLERVVRLRWVSGGKVRVGFRHLIAGHTLEAGPRNIDSDVGPPDRTLGSGLHSRNALVSSVETGEDCRSQL